MVKIVSEIYSKVFSQFGFQTEEKMQVVRIEGESSEDLHRELMEAGRALRKDLLWCFFQDLIGMIAKNQIMLRPVEGGDLEMMEQHYRQQNL